MKLNFPSQNCCFSASEEEKFLCIIEELTNTFELSYTLKLIKLVFPYLLIFLLFLKFYSHQVYFRHTSWRWLTFSLPSNSILLDMEWVFRLRLFFWFFLLWFRLVFQNISSYFEHQMIFYSWKNHKGSNTIKLLGSNISNLSIIVWNYFSCKLDRNWSVIQCITQSQQQPIHIFQTSLEWP